MTTTMREAAVRLVDHIHAPPGTVNAMLVADQAGPLIRILVAPEVAEKIALIPDSFDGYRVQVATRGQVRPLH